jgi:cyclopropane fatty-acyl-phospholipid synthase-like methyltransferase
LSFEKLATKYVGKTAEDYERVRAGQKWDTEHEAIEQLLASVPRSSTVLDIPIGTGRLLPLFKARDFQIFGADVSQDMLAQARATAQSIGRPIHLEEADIRSLPFPTDAFDLVVCLRFLNLVDERSLDEVLRELSRVSKGRLLIGVRYKTDLSEMKTTPGDIGRLMARPIWIARWVYHLCFGYPRQSRAHHQSYLFKLIASLNLEVARTRRVERRWDSTDYVLLLLEKTSAR